MLQVTKYQQPSQKQNQEFKIIVVGYYYHNNIGDDQYMETFQYIFSNYLPKYEIQYVDCDKIMDVEVNDSDIIILGGGDILNDYFLDKIIEKCKQEQIQNKNKIFAVSVGIPYLNVVIKTNKLHIID